MHGFGRAGRPSGCAIILAVAGSLVAGGLEIVQRPSLACEEGLPGGLPGHFFEELDKWQRKYARDSLRMSRDFLYGAYELKVFPHLEESLRKCPVPVLEIMMNAVLAADADYSVEGALALFQNANEAASMLQGEPSVSQLIHAWRHDTVHVYPFLFGLRRSTCSDTGLKVFVYEVPQNLTSPLLHCALGQWGTEVLFHRYFLHSDCRTDNPDEADFFYVPIYGTCLFVKHDADGDESARELLWDPLLHYLGQQESFHRRNRRDHIFLFADGQSARIWDSYDLLRSDAIFMMVESKCPTWDEPMSRYTDVKACSSPWKDVVIPGHTDYARLQYMLAQNRPLQERDILMTFHGRHPGSHSVYENCKVRGQVMELAEYPDVDVGDFVDDYLERKGRARFCLVPGGTSPWTNHLYESFFCGCIPVILSDEYDVAFQDQLDWPKVSIKWPESEVGPLLYDFLKNFPLDILEEMKQEVDKHACWFNYFSEDESCSPYLAVLRALQERKRRSPARRQRFWGADRAFEAAGGLANPSSPGRRLTRFHAAANQTFMLWW